MFDIDSAFNRFKEQKEYLENIQEVKLTETDTRCKIIDIIFKDILLWDEANIMREENVKDEDKNYYVDYIFESNSNRFLIEAKKNGVYFNTPTLSKRCKRSGVVSNEVTTKDAIHQAYNYCLSKKINVGCICNGTQIIVFIINPGAKYDTYIFNGPLDIMEDFVNFCAIFNPYESAFENLKRILSSVDKPIRKLPLYINKISKVVYNSDERISRNPIDYYIRPIIDEFFSDLTSNKHQKYLNECYCSDTRVSNYEKQLTALLIDDTPRIGIPVQDSDYLKQDFLRKERQLADQIEISSDVGVLVGGVGAGKTTFIHRFFKHVLPQEIQDRLIWINIDFIEQSSEDIDMRGYILTECLRQIRVNYNYLNIDTWEILQEIYYIDIQRLKDGPLKPLYLGNITEFNLKLSDFLFQKTQDEVKFAEDVLHYIATKKQYDNKTLVIILDNADQLNESFQAKCITTSFEISRKLGGFILFSMREESYWKLRNIKPFDAYPSYAYHVSAPSVATLLKRRLEVAIKYTGKKEIEIPVGNGPIKWKTNIADFFNMLKSSLFSTNSSNIELFEALSANNLRFASEMLGTFLISGHTNTQEYIYSMLAGGGYQIPYHAFVRSIALGDFKYYQSEKSLLLNVLDIDEDGFYSHFNRLRILKYLKERMSISNDAGKGFVNVSEMYNSFSSVCNNEASFRSILTPLLNKRLIEADNGYKASGTEARNVKLTSAGWYYLEHLIYEFAYLERLCEDTPIHLRSDFEELNRLTNLINNNNIKSIYKVENRLERVRVFLMYLQKQEKEETKYIDDTVINYKFIGDIQNAFTQQSNNILSKAKSRQVSN